MASADLCVLCGGQGPWDLKDGEVAGGEEEENYGNVVCGSCKVLIGNTVRCKKEVIRREEEVRRRQWELLIELRKMEGQVEQFKELMGKVDQLSKVGSEGDKGKCSRKQKKELEGFRENVWRVIEDLRNFQELISQVGGPGKTPGTRGATLLTGVPIKTEGVPDTAYLSEEDNDRITEEDGLSFDHHLMVDAKNDLMDGRLGDEDTNWDFSPAAPSDKESDPDFEYEDAKVQKTTSSLKRGPGRPRKVANISREDNWKKKRVPRKKKRAKRAVSEETDEEEEERDSDFEIKAPKKKKTSPTKTPAVETDSHKRRVGRPRKGEVVKPSESLVVRYRLVDNIMNKLEDASEFKSALVRRVLLSMQRRDRYLHKGATHKNDNLIEDDDEAKRLLKTLDLQYLIEYDPTQDNLHLNTIPILINEEQQSLDCSLCGYTAINTRHRIPGKGFVEFPMLDHLLGVHLDAYKCPFCSRQLESRSQFLSHIRLNHKEKPQITCDICGRPQQSPALLRLHRWSHKSAQEKAAAEAAGEAPPTRGSTDLTKWPYTCSICGKRLSSKQNLVSHEQSHDPNKEQVLCPGCGKNFAVASFKNHQKICGVPVEQRKEGAFQCHLCDKAYSLKGSLKTHLDTHFGNKRQQKRREEYHEKKYLCAYCPRRFGVNKELREHLASHQVSGSNERPFPCRKKCGKSFNYGRCRKQHEAGCTGERERKCPHCGEFFKNIRKHLNQRTCQKKGEERKRFQCWHCDKNFAKNSSLKGHLEKVAGGKVWMCRKGCGRSFREEEGKKEHDKRCGGHGEMGGKGGKGGKEEGESEEDLRMGQPEVKKEVALPPVYDETPKYN